MSPAGPSHRPYASAFRVAPLSATASCDRKLLDGGAARCSSSRTGSRRCSQQRGAAAAGPAPAGGVRAQGGAGRDRSDPAVARRPRCGSPRRTARPACPRSFERAARAARGPGLPARLLAGRELRDQLPALFRHQPAGRPAHGAGGEVFEATHRLLLRLIAEGKVQGVRLDHIDGLYDPRGYCQRLLSRAADVLAEAGRRTARDRCAPGPPDLPRGREDPGAPRVAARGSAGRRHHRLRVHEPRQRSVRRSRCRALADRHLSSLHRPGARVRPGGARRQAADPALLSEQRAARARRTSSTASRSRAGGPATLR